MSRAKGRGLLFLVLAVLPMAGVAAGADAQTNVVSLTIDDQTIVVSGAPNGGES